MKRKIKVDRSISDIKVKAKQSVAVQDIMDDIIGILDNQVGKLKRKAITNMTDLTSSDIIALQKYSKCAVDLSKELRELEKNTDLTDLTDDELLARFHEMEEKLDNKRKLEKS